MDLSTFQGITTAGHRHSTRVGEPSLCQEPPPRALHANTPPAPAAGVLPPAILPLPAPARGHRTAPLTFSWPRPSPWTAPSPWWRRHAGPGPGRAGEGRGARPLPAAPPAGTAAPGLAPLRAPPHTARVARSLHSREIASHAQVALAEHRLPITRQHGAGPAAALWHPPSLHTWTRGPLSRLFSRLKRPNSLSPENSSARAALPRSVRVPTAALGLAPATSAGLPGRTAEPTPAAAPAHGGAELGSAKPSSALRERSLPRWDTEPPPPPRLPSGTQRSFLRYFLQENGRPHPGRKDPHRLMIGRGAVPIPFSSGRRSRRCRHGECPGRPAPSAPHRRHPRPAAAPHRRSLSARPVRTRPRGYGGLRARAPAAGPPRLRARWEQRAAGWGRAVCSVRRARARAEQPRALVVRHRCWEAAVGHTRVYHGCSCLRALWIERGFQSNFHVALGRAWPAVRGSWSALLLSPGEAVPGAQCPALGSSVQDGHGTPGAVPVDGSEDDWGTGAFGFYEEMLRELNVLRSRNDDWKGALSVSYKCLKGDVRGWSQALLSGARQQKRMHREFYLNMRKNLIVPVHGHPLSLLYPHSLFTLPFSPNPLPCPDSEVRY